MSNIVDNTLVVGNRVLDMPKESEMSILRELLPSDMTKDSKDSLIVEYLEGTDVDETVTLRELYKENLLSYSGIAKEGNVKITDYVVAVKYITYRNSGLGNYDAYKLAKKDDVVKALADGVTEKQLRNRAKAYAQTMIVKQIQAQGNTNLRTMFADYVIDGVERMHDIVQNGSDKNAVEAFKSLMQYIAPPVESKVTVEAGAVDRKMDELLRMKGEMAVGLSDSIRNGKINIDELISGKNLVDVVEGEYKDVGNTEQPRTTNSKESDSSILDTL